MRKKALFAKLDAAGRLALPKEIRERWHAAPGDILRIEQQQDGSISIQKELQSEAQVLDHLAEHALKEFRQGKTKSLDEVLREMES